MAAATVVEFLSTISDGPTLKPEDIEASSRNRIPDEAQTNFFALIIGINEYTSLRINNLKGAVADAKAMLNYLVDDLKVPSDQIKTLYDKEATRENIIKAVQGLATDDRIQNQDPIIIFYAGHGGQLEPPVGWETGGRRIQSIIPHDESAVYDSKDPVPSIPDYVLAALLDNLSREKGDNVTVIFDCCHSTSGTRDTERLPRSVESKNLAALSLDIDKDILGSFHIPSAGRGSSVPKGFHSTGSRSHVLIAACGAEESAWETPDARGAFTVALLNVLKDVKVDAITYTGLVARLPALPSQMPQCEGEHRGRILFNSQVLGASHQFIKVVEVEWKYDLQAGAAQGIAVGAQFDLHRNNVLDPAQNPPIGRFTVRWVGPFRSTLVPDDLQAERPTGTMFARQVLEGKNYELSVFFTPALVQAMYQDQTGWKSAFNSNNEQAEFRFAETDQKAELVVDVQGDKAVFEVRNPIINSNGLVQLPASVPAKAEFILPVLRAAAKWNWHVNRTNPNDPFKGKVRIEMTRLHRPAPRARPIPVGDNLNLDGVVDLVLGPKDIYGFKLINESEYDLHPYLFYFDASDQSIECYYSGPQGGVKGSDAQLPGTGKDGKRPRGELTLGYGPGGVIGLTMGIPKGQENGVVCFKLFVTTSPTTFDLLNQASPFTSTGRKLVVMDYDAADQAVLWGTAMMVVAQRTTPKPSTATPAT